jgi:predicted translin family RNA/ssDNA-binding protein
MPVAPPPAVDAAVPPGETEHDRAVREAREKLDQISRDMQRVDHDVTLATRAVQDAHTDAERKAAADKLAKLKAEMDDLRKRNDDAKRDLDRVDHDHHH